MANASGAIAHTQLIHVRSAAGTEVIVGDVSGAELALPAHLSERSFVSPCGWRRYAIRPRCCGVGRGGHIVALGASTAPPAAPCGERSGAITRAEPGRRLARERALSRSRIGGPPWGWGVRHRARTGFIERCCGEAARRIPVRIEAASTRFHVEGRCHDCGPAVTGVGHAGDSQRARSIRRSWWKEGCNSTRFATRPVQGGHVGRGRQAARNRRVARTRGTGWFTVVGLAFIGGHSGTGQRAPLQPRARCK